MGTGRNLSAKKQNQCESRPTKKQPPASPIDTISWVVLFILFLLLFFNAALYVKLWGLEKNEKYFNPSDYTFQEFRQMPQTQEEWQKFVIKQEQLHSAEIERWVRVLKASVHLLNQVEQSLFHLQTSLQHMMNMTSLQEEVITDELDHSSTHGADL